MRCPILVTCIGSSFLQALVQDASACSIVITPLPSPSSSPIPFSLEPHTDTTARLTNPNPPLAALKNLLLLMYFPLITPSTASGRPKEIHPHQLELMHTLTRPSSPSR